jgi:hypothetical protein
MREKNSVCCPIKTAVRSAVVFRTNMEPVPQMFPKFAAREKAAQKERR